MAEQQVRMHPRRPPAATACFSYCAWQATGRGTATDPAMRPDGRKLYPRSEVIGELLRCEIYRHACFQGESDPVLFSRRPPGWRIC